MSNRIAAIDGGMSYHQVALNDARWAHLIDTRLYLPEMASVALSAFDVVIATCRSNPELLAPLRRQFLRFLDNGGTVVAFAGTGPERWLPGVEARAVPTNYWWWLEGDADSGLRAANEDHSIYSALTLKDFTWHHHARFKPPPGALSLVDHVTGGSIFYEDQISTRGRMLVTSLDPFFHHGSYFMPATTCFLEAFLPWLKEY